jgi:hypothetical protein
MATYAAASASYADVAAAIALASAGDSVTVPAGSATWATPITYSKAITLQGNGTGSTVITATGGGIAVTGTEGSSFRITGLEFAISAGQAIYTLGNCHSFRIDHCKIMATGYTYGILVGSLDDTDQQYGVIDNCIFDNCKVLVMPGVGDKSWKEPTGLGTDASVYIEDCTFTQSDLSFANCIDSNNGSRYVFRNNTVSDDFIMAHPLQNAGETFFTRGSRKWEVYDNTITATTSAAHWSAIGMSGGTGVIFNNEVVNNVGVANPFDFAITVSNKRTYENVGYGLGIANGGNIIDGNTAVATGTGAHSGANGAAILTCAGKTWTPDAYIGNYVYNLTDGSKGAITDNDGTTVTATLSGGTDNDWDTGDTFKITNGYPALDQPGRGIDYSLVVQALPAYNSSYQPQALEPIYVWGNTLDGSANGMVIADSCEKHIVENRDFYDDPVSFDGTAGVGVGLLAARPATCTTGVGYWATDTNILYRAVATNTWEAYYTPYTYPHPLRGEGVAPDVMTVTSPNGGESWAGNSVHNIIWTNTGDTVYANVKIEYSTNSGLTWTTITASTANTGSYAWTVPNTAGAAYMVKVTAVV